MKNSIILLMNFLVLMLFSACDIFSPDSEKGLAGIEVNPAFEMLPPIADNIFFEVLDKPRRNGDNIRVMVEFPAGEVAEKYLAFELSGGKEVVRDDGKGADLKAGDGIFSIFLKEDLDALEAEFERRAKLLDKDERIISFKNRGMVVQDKKDIPVFNWKELQKARRPFPFPKEIITGLKSSLDESKTLMITDLGVVEDDTRTFNPCSGVGNPSGVWTFGELMRQLASPAPGSIANDAQVSAFVMNWLNTWTSNATINGELLPARNVIQNHIITPWLNRSALNGAPAGQLSMQFAPFRLLAIVNRVDLRGNSGYGSSNAGEGRFIFTALDEDCNVLLGGFNVIFEYGVNKKGCANVKAYAQEWVDLNALALGSVAYNQALEDITLQFTQSGTNPSKPNQSSLNQIRTNEIALGSPWELREFNLNPSGSSLDLVDVKQEPAVKYNAKTNNPDVERLARFINDNEASIEANKYTVPLVVPLNAGTPTPTTEFRGGKAHTEFPPTSSAPGAHHWDGTSTPGSTFVNSDLARHIFSLNTCSGCHGGETQTFFTHVDPFTFGSEATLSGFLTGEPGRGGAFDADGPTANGEMAVMDPADRPSGSPDIRVFKDLERRKLDLNDLVNNLCLKTPFFELAHLVTFEPVRMVH